MPDVLVTFLRGAAVFCIAFIASSLILAAAYPAFRRLLCASPPHRTSACLLTFALMAPLSAGNVLLLSEFPGLAPLLVPSHCHGAACGVHVPVVELPSAGGITAIVLGGLIIPWATLVGLRALVAGRRRMATLFMLSTRPEGRDYRVIDTDALFAWCCGLLRPKLLVSRGLVDSLAPVEFEAVLAHERAHAYRLDNLRQLLFRWAVSAWPVRRRHAVRRQYHLATEAACDAAAVRLFGDRNDYARLLARVTQRGTGQRHAMAMLPGQGEAGARLAMLSAPGGGARNLGCIVLAVMALWAAQVLLGTAIAHYVIELLGH